MPVFSKNLAKPTPVKREYQSRLTAVGAYIFAGGFTVGIKNAGFNILGHLEGDKYGVSSFQFNFPDVPVHIGPDAWPKEFPGGKVDFIYGNPPCAAWSGNNPTSHKEDGWMLDPRVNCTRKHFQLLLDHQPKVWAWESVCAAPIKGKKLVDELTGKAVAAGYSVTHVFHDAQFLGCAQIRRRWFLIAHKVKLSFVEPVWEPKAAVDVLKKAKKCGTVAYDSRMNKVIYAKHIHKMKPGMRLRTLFQKVLYPDPDKRTIKANGHIKGCPGFGHVKLKDKGPASATVGYSMIHPTEDRFLTINEVAVIAGFPDGYKFVGGELGSQQLDLIARGVCPPVGEWLGKSVKQSLEMNIPVRKPVVSIVDFRAKGIAPIIIGG